MQNFINAILELKLLEFLPITVRTFLLFYLFLKVLDFITGVQKTRGNSNNPFKSSKMRDGFKLWFHEMLGISFVFSFDLVMGLDFYLTGLTLIGFVYKEARSIKENLDELGVKLPGVVDEKIESLNKEDGKDG